MFFKFIIILTIIDNVINCLFKSKLKFVELSCFKNHDDFIKNSIFYKRTLGNQYFAYYLRVKYTNEGKYSGKIFLST